MRRWPALLAAAALFCTAVPARADGVSTGASSAILMDADSGRILYAQDIHQPRLIASTTKLLTALVAVEREPDLEQVVTIRPEWLGSEGSSIYLQAGEQITLRALLYGLLLHSGNDAAMAIACFVAGDEMSFAAMMNEKAGQLGMTHSSFANASGLNQEGHYSTAYDMALLACACLDNPVVAEICATRSARVGGRSFTNHNKLLYQYEGCVGMKTGYTQRAGRTLVSAARREGQTLVCVTLNDPSDWEDHKALLDYGFSAYPSTRLCSQNQRLGLIPVEGSLLSWVAVAAAQEVRYPLGKDDVLQTEVELAGALPAPVEEGMPAGVIRWYLDGREVAAAELVCAHGAGADRYEPMDWLRWFRNLGKGRAEPGFGARLI